MYLNNFILNNISIPIQNMLKYSICSNNIKLNKNEKLTEFIRGFSCVGRFLGV